MCVCNYSLHAQECMHFMCIPALVFAVMLALFTHISTFSRVLLCTGECVCLYVCVCVQA